MGNLRNDAKDLLIGNDGSEKEPEENFELELQKSLKQGIISEDEGKKLTVARDNVDRHAKELDKNQVDAVKRINVKEVYESAAEERAAIEKAERKKKQEEKEAEERKRKETQIANKIQQESKKKKQNNVTKTQKEREN